MIKRTLTLRRISGNRASVTLGVADHWDDKRAMTVLVPELRRSHPWKAGDRFTLEPIDPTKD